MVNNAKMLVFSTFLQTSVCKPPGLYASSEELEHFRDSTVYHYTAKWMKMCCIRLLLQWILIQASQNPSQMVSTGEKQHKVSQKNIHSIDLTQRIQLSTILNHSTVIFLTLNRPLCYEVLAMINIETFIVLNSPWPEMMYDPHSARLPSLNMYEKP